MNKQDVHEADLLIGTLHAIGPEMCRHPREIKTLVLLIDSTKRMITILIDGRVEKNARLGETLIQMVQELVKRFQTGPIGGLQKKPSMMMMVLTTIISTLTNVAAQGEMDHHCLMM